MTQTGEYRPDVALVALDLLARETPASELEKLIAQGVNDGASTETAARLDMAKGLALRVSALIDQCRQDAWRLSALVEAARELAVPADTDAMCKVLARRARLLLGLDLALVTFDQPATDQTSVRAADGQITACAVGVRAARRAGLGGAVAARSAPFWTSDYLADRRFEHDAVLDDIVRAEGVHAMMAVPLRQGGSLVGGLQVAARNVRYFAPADISLLDALADLAMISIDRAEALDVARVDAAMLQQDNARLRADRVEAERIEDIHGRLVGLVLDGCELDTLVDVAATALGGTLAVCDSAGRHVAGGALSPPTEDELSRYTIELSDRDPPVLSDDGTWLLPVRTRSEGLGVLLFRGTGPLEPHQATLFAIAARVVALLLVERQRWASAVTDGQIRDELFHDLLGSPSRPAGYLIARARKIGVDLTEPQVMLVSAVTEQAREKAGMWAAAYARRAHGLAGAYNGRIVLLLPGADADATARSVAGQLSSRLGLPVTAGAAGPVSDPAAVYGTYQEALRYLETLLELDAVGCTASARDLGFLGILLSGTPDVDGFVRSTIGPVLDYDDERTSDLIRTLEAYFASGGSPVNAAEALNVHPNTVSRRLNRVTTLLGANWRVPNRALEIHVALRLQRIRRVLRQPGSRQGPAGP